MCGCVGVSACVYLCARMYVYVFSCVRACSSFIFPSTVQYNMHSYHYNVHIIIIQ